MFIALQDGERTTATSLAHQKYTCVCPCCNEPVIARCGVQHISHWAHANLTNCPNSAGETEWHLQSKSVFDKTFEIERGDIFPDRRPDVCIQWGDSFKVLEFQNSPITAEEIEAREQDYLYSVAWIVNVQERPGFEFWDAKKPGQCRFTWKWASKVWDSARCPVLFDTGDNLVYWRNLSYTKTLSGWKAFVSCSLGAQQKSGFHGLVFKHPLLCKNPALEYRETIFQSERQCCDDSLLVHGG